MQNFMSNKWLGYLPGAMTLGTGFDGTVNDGDVDGIVVDTVSDDDVDGVVDEKQDEKHANHDDGVGDGVVDGRFDSVVEDSDDAISKGFCLGFR